ncbi:MAG: S8 family serine peptidase [Candidatus Riflebacteria bacterium]|nr:S8 family serine peptidase [Candidatus Riflebacteria bacterium]
MLSQSCSETTPADYDETTTGCNALIEEGRRQNRSLIQIFPEARLIDVAGGAIVDLSDEDFAACQETMPGLSFEDLSAHLEPVQTSNLSAPKTQVSAPPPWNHEQSGANWFYEFGMTGTGMRLGIIAMNYSLSHPALKGRIKNLMKFGIPDAAKAVSDLHLLHPLGIFGGFEEGRFRGIAIDSEISLAMLASKPAGADAMLEALDWLIKQEEPPHAILICTDFATTAPGAVARALFACRNAGIVPIISAGNNPNTITGMAALPCCITIGATDRWRQRVLFSGQGPVAYGGQKIIKPDFCEPGSAVIGPAEGNEYRLGSGTLQAAAHFAGVFLLMRQALPDTDPEILLNAIRLTSEDIDASGIDDSSGYGIPRPSAAIGYVNTPPSDNAGIPYF